MKQIITFFALILLITAPVGGCRVFKKIQKNKSEIKVDSTTHIAVLKENSSADSSLSKVDVKKSEAANYSNITVTESAKDVLTERFVITSKFAIDTTAGGDTIRFVSQEDDRVKVSIYYDKKTKQAVAEIENKSRPVKVPFSQVSITNANINTAFDSSAFEKHSLFNHSKIDSSALTGVKKEATTKTINRETKKDFGLLKWIGLIVLIAAVLRLAIYLLRKQFPWVRWLNKFLGGK